MQPRDLLRHDAIVYHQARPPRGAWRVVGAAAFFTLGIFVLLPLAEKLTPPSTAEPLKLRQASLLRLPDPPPVLQPLRHEPTPPTPVATPPPPPPTAPSLPPPPRPPTPAQPLNLALTPPVIEPVADLTFPIRPPAPTPPEPIAQPEPPPEPAPQATPAAPPAEAEPAPTPMPAAPAVYGSDEVDQLPKALHAPRPPYPQVAQRRRLEGYADARFVVTREGNVTEIEIIDARPSGLFEATTREGLSNWRFQPASRDGRPVAVRVQLRIRYQLD